MAEYRMLVDLNMSGQQIKNAVLENVASAPASTVAGQIVYNTTDSTAYISNGTELQAVATQTYVQTYVESEMGTELANYIKSSEKGVADGVATLDASTKVPIAQIPTGNVADGVVALGTALSTGQVVTWDGSQFAGMSLASAYVPRGSVDTFEDLPELTSANVGDVYDIKTAFELGGEQYPAGTNVACVLDAESQKSWDALGGTVDLSGYQTIANMTDLSAPSASTYPTTQAVSTALAGKLDVLATKPTAGTYTKVTIDGEGRVTAGANLEATDIPDLSASYIAVGQKGVADGVATLGADVKVPIAQIPTGNGANLIPVPSGAGTQGQVLTVGSDGIVWQSPSVYTSTVLDITGDDTNTEFVLAHNLGRIPETVQITDAEGNDVGMAVKRDATNVTVSVNVPLGTGNNYKVYITGRVSGSQGGGEDPTPSQPIVLGYTIDESVSDPADAVTYIEGNTGWTPMSMTNGTLNAGSWATESDGQALLDSIKPVVRHEDGSYEDLDKRNPSNLASGGSADLETLGNDFLVYFANTFQWLSITKSGDVVTVKYATEQVDDTYCNYAFLGNDGQAKGGFSVGAVFAVNSGSALYSMPGTVSQGATFGGGVNYASNRGADADIATWDMKNYITGLFPLLFKTLDGRGQMAGLATGSQDAVDNTVLTFTNDYGMNGTADDKTARMAFLWVHDFWGNSSWWVGGIRTSSGYHVLIAHGKRTPLAEGAYTALSADVSDAVGGLITKTFASDAGIGLLPEKTGGTPIEYATRYCSYAKLTKSCALCVGGGNHVGAGPFYAQSVSAGEGMHRLAFKEAESSNNR